MKAAPRKAPVKAHRNFKLNPQLNARLVKEASQTRRTQTAIVEMALEEWFKLKRAAA